MSFSDLGLSEDVLRAVSDAGYTTPTPIQEQAIPLILMGRDVLGCAQTGTGKTAGFTLPMIDILAAGRAKARMPRTLILEPTRELAAQVSENFEVYGKYNKLSMALLIGGVRLDEQIAVVKRGVDVLIATPGRLLDVFERGHLLLNDVKILVIDEADRMLDMGFIPDVERIVSLMSKMRQTLFFSATMPPEIRRLADKFLMNPKEVHVAPPATLSETIVQGVLMVEHKDGKRPGGGQKEKREALRRLIQRESVKNALIFCNRKRDIGVLCRSLKSHGFDVAELHGDMTQPARMETLAKFKDGKIAMLVCSDVAARGLDIVNMSHVFNFDVPTHAEDYVHRIGRTGRAGRQGRALTLGTREDSKYLDAIVALIGIPIPRISADGVVGPALSTAPNAAQVGNDTEIKVEAEGETKTETTTEATAEATAETTPEKPRRRRGGAGRGGAGRGGAGRGGAGRDGEARPSSTQDEEAPVQEARVAEFEVAEVESSDSDKPKEKATPAATARTKSAPRPAPGEKDEPKVGMGDNPPAFMLRSAVGTGKKD